MVKRKLSESLLPLVCHFTILPYFNVICDLLLNRRKVT